MIDSKLMPAHCVDDGQTHVDFLTVPWPDLVVLATQGVIGPHEGVASALLLADRKPILLVPKDIAVRFVNLFDNFDYQIIPGMEGEVWGSNCGVYRRGHPDRFARLAAAYALYPGDLNKGILAWPDCLPFHVAVGRALGYTEADVARYVLQNYGEDKFTAWQRQTIVST